MSFRVWSFVVLVLMITIAGCDRSGTAWEQAQEQDTVAAYEEFLQQYAESDQAVEARQRLTARRREQGWELASQADTADAYQAFLAQFPDSPQSEQARSRIESLQAQRRWERLEDSNDIAALRAFTERYGEHPAAEHAQQRIDRLEAEAREHAREAERQRRLAEEAAHTHRVQLAALRTEDQARSGVSRLQERLADVLEDTQLEVVAAGNYHFVRTVPMREEQAIELCKRLKDRSQDCLVVPR